MGVLREFSGVDMSDSQLDARVVCRVRMYMHLGT